MANANHSLCSYIKKEDGFLETCTASYRMHYLSKSFVIVFALCSCIAVARANSASLFVRVYSSNYMKKISVLQILRYVGNMHQIS